MAKITIDLEQARSRLSRREGRLLIFPDGIARLIALPHRQWHMYDELRGEWVGPGDCEMWSYNLATEKMPPDATLFEDELRVLFSLTIETGWAVLNEGLRGNANEN